MPANLIHDPAYNVLFQNHVICDDFSNDIDSAEWVKTGDTNSTAAVGDGSSSVLLKPGDDNDNEECYLESPNETFLVAANKPIVFEAKVKFAEANTDDANIIVGLKDAVAANTLQDNGAGPSASYSGFVFFKEDGQTLWSVESSNAGTQTTTQLTAANSLDKTAKTAGSTAWQRLRIEVLPYSSTNAKVNFFIDSTLVATHDYVYTSCTDMQVCFGVKNGGTTAGGETLHVEAVYCSQKK